MNEENDKVRAFHRREAQAGRVSYGDPVIIRDSSQSRVQFVPFFVRRSHGTELALKIVTYKKSPPPSDWVLLEQKSLSLNESESRQLLSALRDHLAVAETDEDGRYILIRVDEGTASIGTNDPAAVAAALAKVLSQDEIVEHLGATELADSLINAFRGAIRLKEMRSAVAALRGSWTPARLTNSPIRHGANSIPGHSEMHTSSVTTCEISLPSIQLTCCCRPLSPAIETSSNSRDLIVRSFCMTATTEIFTFQLMCPVRSDRCTATWTYSTKLPPTGCEIIPRLWHTTREQLL